MNSNELINFINSIKNNKTKVIPNYDAYAVNAYGYLGVAIELNEDIHVHEKFNRVELADANINIDGRSHRVIFLFTKEKYMDDHYGMLCLDFIKMEKRDSISKKPLIWFQEWSDLLGNSKKTKMVYDVIGEMKVLVELVKKGYQPSWDSMEHNTFDISTNNELFEIKTSTSKYETLVTIHNQFQLEPLENKNLYVVFVRVEKSEVGESIDSLRNELASLGYDIENVDKYLTDIGYYLGKIERCEKYIVHEIRKYIVDEKFPKITKESFIGNEFPNGVVKLEYTITLDGLEYTEL